MKLFLLLLPLPLMAASWALEECRPGIECRYVRHGYSGETACRLDLASQGMVAPSGTRLRCLPEQGQSLTPNPTTPPVTCWQWGIDFCRIP